MFKVLVTGAKGQVGSELIKLVPTDFTVIGLGSAELDITDQQQVNEAIALHQPDLVINAAAYTAVDKAESDINNAYAVNEQAVAWLAQATVNNNIPLFHISTDYVFDGKLECPYKETALPNPQNIYGASKFAGEKTLAEKNEKHIILRASWVFGAEGSNFVKTMLRLAKRGDELSVVADQYGCPISAVSIASVLWQLAIKYQQDKNLPWGIYHFSNSPACTWYEFALEIFKQAKHQELIYKEPKVYAITTAEYPTAAKRPGWSVLCSTKIESLLGFQVPSWKNELSQLLSILKDKN